MNNVLFISVKTIKASTLRNHKLNHSPLAFYWSSPKIEKLSDNLTDEPNWRNKKMR